MIMCLRSWNFKLHGKLKKLFFIDCFNLNVVFNLLLFLYQGLLCHQNWKVKFNLLFIFYLSLRASMLPLQDLNFVHFPTKFSLQSVNELRSWGKSFYVTKAGIYATWCDERKFKHKICVTSFGIIDLFVSNVQTNLLKKFH